MSPSRRVSSSSPGHCVLWFPQPCVLVKSLPHTIVASLSLHLAVRLSSCRVLIVLITCLHCVLGSPRLNIACVHSSLSCVSAKWVGTNVGRGVLTMVSEINSNNERRHWSSFVVWFPCYNVAPGFHINELRGEEE